MEKGDLSKGKMLDMEKLEKVRTMLPIWIESDFSGESASRTS